MRIQDVMSKNVVSIPSNTTVAIARERLRREEIDHLVIVDEKRIVGVVAGKDILRVADDTQLSAIMTRNVVTIAPEATLRHAAGVMRGHAVGCLPVVSDGQLVGIVTTSDLLTALAKGEIHAAPQSDRVILRKRGPRKRAVSI